MKILCATAIAILAAAILPYYPIKLFALIATGLIAFSLLAWRFPAQGAFFLFFATPFFGNHPGGRFMELFPLLSSVWTIMSTGKDGLRLSRRFMHLYGLYLVFLLLPLVLHPVFFAAASFYKNGFFYLLNANEHSPLYPLQQTVWLALIPILAATVKPYYQHVIAGIASAFALTIVIGIFEIQLPFFADMLDRAHIFLDGYVDRTHPHRITFGQHFFEWLTHSPNSLFWNRSWHAVFIIASLPFASLFLYERVTGATPLRQRFVFIFSSILLTFYLIAVGARGALFSWSAFLFVAGIGWILSRSSSRLIYALPYIAIVGTFLLQLVVPILIVFTEQGRTEFRYPQFAAAFKIFAMFPLTGGGTESYGYYNNFFLRAAAEAVKHGSSHNQLLQIAVGNGLLGILFYFGLLIGFSNEIRKRMIATDLASTPFILITAGMASAIVYGSVQEWNYLRPIILIWAVLLSLPWDYRTQCRSPEANRWWILTPLCILAFLFSYRSLPEYTSLWDPNAMRTKLPDREISKAAEKAFSDTFEPVAPFQGVEYVDPDRFVIMQGESHILLPRELQIGTITPLREDANVTYEWSRAEKGRYLRIRCHSTSPDLRGDFDARRLCAEITIPESTKFFQSLERPALYRERTKQRGLF